MAALRAPDLGAPGAECAHDEVHALGVFLPPSQHVLGIGAEFRERNRGARARAALSVALGATGGVDRTALPRQLLVDVAGKFRRLELVDEALEPLVPLLEIMDRQ